VIILTDKRQKVKSIPLQGWIDPEGSRRLRLPDFMKEVRLSGLCTDRLYPQEIFLVLVSIRIWANLRTIVQPEELCQWKIPVTPSGIEPATFRLVTQCLNQLPRRVPQYFTSKWELLEIIIRHGKTSHIFVSPSVRTLDKVEGDPHTSAASSRLTSPPPARRFKWTGPFRWKTKSDFCACAITFQTQSNYYSIGLQAKTQGTRPIPLKARR
jgi:hypothetical protein